MSDFHSLQEVHAFAADADEFARRYCEHVQQWRNLRERHNSICNDLLVLEAVLKNEWYVLRMKKSIQALMKDGDREWVSVKQEPVNVAVVNKDGGAGGGEGCL